MIHERRFQALLFATTIPPLGSTLVSPILDSLIGPFGTSPVDIGLMISVFTAPSIVTIPIAGLISDRYGRKPVLVGALCLFGIAGLAILTTTDYEVVLAFRLLQGIGFGGSMPIVTTSIGDLYSASDEATAQGLRLSMSGLSATVFPLLAGLLVLGAWQYPFLLYGIAIPIAVFVTISFKETKSNEKQPFSKTARQARRSQFRSVLEKVKKPHLATIIIGRGLPTFAWISFLTYNSLIVIRAQGGAPVHAGLMFALGSLSMALASSQAGRLTDLFGSSFYPLVGANLGLLSGLIVFLFAPGLAFSAVGPIITGAGFGVSLTLYRSTVNGMIDDSLRGSIVSLSEAFGRMVATLTPILTGTIITLISPDIGMVSAVQIAVLCAAIIGTWGGLACLFLLGSTSSVWRLDTLP